MVCVPWSLKSVVRDSEKSIRASSSLYATECQTRVADLSRVHPSRSTCPREACAIPGVLRLACALPQPSAHYLVGRAKLHIPLWAPAR